MAGTTQEKSPYTIFTVIIEPDTKTILEDALCAENYQLKHFAQADNLINLLKQQKCNLIILQLTPQNTQAIDICKHLRQSPLMAHLPILIITEEDDMQSIELAFQAGMTDFICKPLYQPSLNYHLSCLLRTSETTEKLRLVQTRQNAVLRALPDIIIRTRNNGKIHYINFPRNYQHTALFQLDKENTIQDLIPQEILEQVKSDDVSEVTLKQHDKQRDYELRHCTTTSQDDFFILRDITEKKLNERLNERLGKVLDNSSNDIIIFEQHSRKILQTNQCVRTNLQYSEQEISTLIFDDFMTEQSSQQLSGGYEALFFDNNYQISNSSAPKKIDFKRKDGTSYPVEVVFHRSTHEHPIVLVAMAIDMSLHYQQEETLKKLSYYDPLTKLPNKKLFMRELNAQMGYCEQYNHSLAFILIDIDNFERVTNSFGGAVADGILQQVAERITNCLELQRSQDNTFKLGDNRCFLARESADKFLLMKVNIKNTQQVIRVIQKIKQTLIPPFVQGDTNIVLTASMGVSIFPMDGTNVEDINKNADIALHYAKQMDKNNYQFFVDSMHRKSKMQIKIESQLRNAIENREFQLFFQPQVNTITNQVIGAEALIRWQTPEGKWISPTEFIPIAEESELILPIGNWVLSKTAAYMKAWSDKGVPPLKISVNVSAIQLKQQQIMYICKEIFKLTKDCNCDLQLEITESMLMSNIDETVKLVNEIKEMGIKFSLDDFGTGYSSLSYLQRFPFDSLKVDRSFVRNLTHGKDNESIIIAILALAKGLGLEVVVEGVESQSQLEFVKSHGAKIIQGFYYSKALTAKDFYRYVIEHSNP